MGIFAVKKIKGHYYVYMKYRVRERYKIKYVGPLEKIMREYFELKREFKRGCWWTGRDLNPGPLGCQPSALPG